MKLSDLLHGENIFSSDITCEYTEETTNGDIILKVRGSFTMTNYQIRFLPDISTLDKRVASEKLVLQPGYFDIPLGCISKVEFKSRLLVLKTKDFRTFLFTLVVESEEKLSHLLALTMQIIYPNSMSKLFAFLMYKLSYHVEMDGIIINRHKNGQELGY